MKLVAYSFKYEYRLCVKGVFRSQGACVRWFIPLVMSFTKVVQPIKSTTVKLSANRKHRTSS